jgi:hypothetical protein
MSAFFKTLFGDAGTVTVVTLVMAAQLLLVATGHAQAAGFAIPPLVLAGVGWLAGR